MLGKFIDGIVGFFVGWIKFGLFLIGLALVLTYGIIHSALYGGQIITNDGWFLVKVMFCVIGPFAVAIVVSMCVGRLPGFIAFVLSFGVVYLLMGSGMVTFNISDRAPSFRKLTPYTVANGVITVNPDASIDCSLIGADANYGGLREKIADEFRAIDQKSQDRCNAVISCQTKTDASCTLFGKELISAQESLGEAIKAKRHQNHEDVNDVPETVKAPPSETSNCVCDQPIKPIL